ncbi:hypothetical protein ACFLVN_00500 [Chloroflexota bacterium]
MVNLSVEISEDQSSTLDEVLDWNLGWTKALVVRALLAYFLKLNPSEQEDLVKKHGVVKRARKRMKEI